MNTIIKIKKIFWLMSILAPIILAPTAYPASFDCTRAMSRVEKLICGDAELSRLDEEMKTAYQQASQNAADPVGLRAEQKQWLGLRDFCKDAGCVNQVYRARLASLYSMIQASKPCFRLLERKWPEVASGHYPVCVDLLKSMNTYCSYLPLCEWKVDPFITSLSVPQWEELDPREHLKLIQHMYQGQSDFQAPEEQWEPIPPDTLRNIHEGKTRLWRAWIDVDRDGQKEYVVRFQSMPCADKIDFYGAESKTWVSGT